MKVPAKPLTDGLIENIARLEAENLRLERENERWVKRIKLLEQRLEDIRAVSNGAILLRGGSPWRPT